MYVLSLEPTTKALIRGMTMHRTHRNHESTPFLEQESMGCARALYFYAGGSKRQNPLGILSVTHRARARTTGKKPLKNLRTFFNLSSRNRDLISVQMSLSRSALP